MRDPLPGQTLSEPVVSSRNGDEDFLLQQMSKPAKCVILLEHRKAGDADDRRPLRWIQLQPNERPSCVAGGGRGGHFVQCPVTAGRHQNHDRNGNVDGSADEYHADAVRQDGQRHRILPPQTWQVARRTARPHLRRRYGRGRSTARSHSSRHVTHQLTL